MTAPTLHVATEFHALRAAALRAAQGGAWRRRQAADWLAELEARSLWLQATLRAGQWRPGPLLRFAIRDPKPRIISAAPFVDRVVHHAVCAALEPALERRADPDSHACRTGRGSHAAVRRVQALARRHAWFGKLDVRHFFETADHAVLRQRLHSVIVDSALREVLERILAGGASAPRRGLPIGNLTSQHFGNDLLGLVDHHARHRVKVAAWVRYMDDMLVFGADKAMVGGQIAALTAFISDALHQGVKGEATRLAPVVTGIPWLGFRVWPGTVRLDAARLRRWRRRVRRVARARRAGELTDDAAARVESAVDGWVAQGDTVRLRRSLRARLARDGVVTPDEVE